MAKKVPFIEQMEHSECGLASLAMVFKYHGKHVSLAELREKFVVPKGGHLTIPVNDYWYPLRFRR